MGFRAGQRPTKLNGGEAAIPALRVSPTCRIPLSELRWRFSPSGGPGGQHANKANTRAEVQFDIATSPSLGPRQRARLIERLGSSVRVVADDERSQTRNRELALERLRTRLADALRVQPARRATKTPRSVTRKRLDTKRRRSEIKRLRAKPPLDS